MAPFFQNNFYRGILAFFLCSVMASCAISPAMSDLKQRHREVILPGDFGICKGYGCRTYQKTGLAPEEWRAIAAVFDPPAPTAEAERGLIQQAIALFEQYVGPKTQTAQDKAGAMLFNFAPQNQMDCIDEAFNTSTYLHLLRKAGLVRLHALGAPLHRGNYLNRWPHNTATIHVIGPDREINGKGHFVVDSWFHKNGDMPEIVPAAQWSGGWSPETK